MGARDVESWSDWSEVGETLRATLSAEPDLVGQEARVLAAFSTLPPTWRSALWLHEVEGASPAAIGRRLGMSPSAARGMVRTARAALKRHVADQHETDGQPGCRALVSTYRSTPPAYLNRKDSIALREHARHCESCLPLVQDIVVLDRGLRHLLADLRPEEAPSAAPMHRRRGGRHAAPKSFGAGPALTPARGRALAGGLSLAAAAVSVSVLLRPLEGPGSGALEDSTADDDLPDLTRPVAIASAGNDPGTRTAVTERSSAEGRANRSAVFAKATDQSSRSSDGPADQQAPSGPAAPAPIETSPPPATSEPESPAAPPPGGDGSPPPDSDPPPPDSDPPPSDPPTDDPPPSDPPPPSDLPSVEAEVGDDGVTVTVDPAPVPADPVEVGVPLPE